MHPTLVRKNSSSSRLIKQLTVCSFFIILIHIHNMLTPLQSNITWTHRINLEQYRKLTNLNKIYLYIKQNPANSCNLKQKMPKSIGILLKYWWKQVFVQVKPVFGLVQVNNLIFEFTVVQQFRIFACQAMTQCLIVANQRDSRFKFYMMKLQRSFEYFHI